jgi:hypothetical protein
VPPDLFAGIRVRDYHAARAWYERLLGKEPAFLPHATEAVWELAEHRYLFVIENREAPGGAVITIFVDDLDAATAEIASRGIDAAERITLSNGVRKAVYRDADGNEITFGGAPVASDPSQLEFVLNPDRTGIEVRRRAEYDLYLGSSGSEVPLIVYVHGPVRGPVARPREWPVYRGYGALAANAGAGAAIADLDYTDPQAPDAPTAQLERILDAARSENGIDGDRVAIWAFSGGARLVGRWLEAPPEWLRIVGLTYPVAPTVARVAAPLVVTRIGLEDPEIQASVERLLAVAPSATIIDVPHGRHGFDLLDHNPESRDAVTQALDAVTAVLAP